MFGLFKTFENELKEEYINRLSHDTAKAKFELLNSNISNCTNNADVQSCLTEFINIINEVSGPLFKTLIKHESSNFAFAEENKNPWYTDECHEKSYYFLHMIDKYRLSKTKENRVNMVRERSEHKTVIRRCKYEFDREKTNKFVTSKNKNAKQCWDMLKELSHVKPKNIPMSSFEEYFKVVNNPTNPFFASGEDVLYINERYVNNQFSIMFDGLNRDFSQNEIIQSIEQLKLIKSAGPDKLLNEFYIRGIQVFSASSV